MTFVAEMGSLK